MNLTTNITTGNRGEPRDFSNSNTAPINVTKIHAFVKFKVCGMLFPKALGIAGGIHQTAGQVPPAAAIPRRPDVHAPPFHGR